MPAGITEQDFHIGTEFFKNMENPDVIDADVNVHLVLEHKNDTYYLHFTLQGLMHLPCDRCLDPMEHPVDTTFDIAVKFGEGYDDSSDEVLVIPEDDVFLNVAYMLYDTLILTIPMRHVHPQGQCNRAMASVLHNHKPGSDTDDVEEELEEDDIPLPSDD